MYPVKKKNMKYEINIYINKKYSRVAKTKSLYSISGDVIGSDMVVNVRKQQGRCPGRAALLKFPPRMTT